MAVKSQADIDNGAGLALAGSRQKGVELATSAGGTNIAGTDICEEFGHSGSGVGSNINVGSYHTGSGGLVPAAGNTSGNIAGGAAGEKQFSDYIGGASISAPGTFALNELYLNFTQGIQGGEGQFAEAFAYVQFAHEAANNRIRIIYGSGTSAAPHQQQITYYNYVGLSSATWKARYNVTSQARGGDSAGSCFQGSQGALPVQDGYNSGTYYTLSGSSIVSFWWMAYANPNTLGPSCQNSGTVVGEFVQANSSTNVYPFQLQGTLGSDTYNAYAVKANNPGQGQPFGSQGSIALSAGTNLYAPF